MRKPKESLLVQYKTSCQLTYPDVWVADKTKVVNRLLDQNNTKFKFIYNIF